MHINVKPTVSGRQRLSVFRPVKPRQAHAKVERQMGDDEHEEYAPGERQHF